MDRRIDQPSSDQNSTTRTPPGSVAGEVGAAVPPRQPHPPRPGDTSPAAGVTPTPFYPHLPRYTILEPVGHGGMGQVVRARDGTLGREVAIKFLLRPHDAPPGVVERFRREARILAQLDHPHVVPVYDSGEASGFLYYVMKYVPGGSLTRQAATVRTTARRAAELVCKVAVAVQHVHERGVLHRDLKPGNILVDERGEPLVVDFGVAKWDDGQTATTGYAVFGTPPYLAPEVAVAGSHAGDDRSDVWSLGVILYELLAGARPFPGDRRDPELFTRIQADAPPPLGEQAELLSGVDDRLEAVCLKCLAKDPAARYASAAELADDLRRWADGQAVSTTLAAARRAAVGRPAALPVRRRRWPRVAAAVGVLAGAVALLLAPVPWKRQDLKPVARKTLAERLTKAGDSVTFVDDTGKLLERADGEVPGFENEGIVKADGPDGFLELNTTRVYILELGDEPLPFPVALEAGVRARESPVARPTCGVYAGRQAHPRLTSPPIHTAFVNAFGGGWPSNPAAAVGRVPAIASTVRLDPHDRREGELVYFPNSPQLVPEDVGLMTACAGAMGSAAYSTILWDLCRVRGQTVYRLRTERRGDQFRGWRDGYAFPPADPTALPDGLRLLFVQNSEPFAEPPFRDGFGLFVAYGSGQFRGVRLTRLPE
jgi:hypothetical protein